MRPLEEWLNQDLELIAKTRKAKNRLNVSKINKFRVIMTKEKVSFSEGKDWILLCNFDGDVVFWVQPNNDVHFDIKEVI